jgi:hypothetical protein
MDKTALNLSAVQARNIVRLANDEMARVCLQRKKEPAYMTAALVRHFNLPSNGTLDSAGLLVDNTVNKAFNLQDVFKHDRRWLLEQIRQKMLSLSFHLNTGMYLIDQDLNNRDVVTGVKTPLLGVVGAGNEAYVANHVGGKNQLCGFRKGEIHIGIDMMPGYTLNSGARIIVHEAAHKFLYVDDVFYAWDANYPPALDRALDNADSFAWLAVSLATEGCRMDSIASTDWKNCPGGKL